MTDAPARRYPNACTAALHRLLRRRHLRTKTQAQRVAVEASGLRKQACGAPSAKFAIGLDTLLKKSGATCSLKEFRRQIKDVVTSNALPDYSLEFDAAGDVVTIWTRDGGKCLRRMIAEVQERGIATLDSILT